MTSSQTASTDSVNIADIPPISRVEASELATTEYSRFVDVLRELRRDDWNRATACDLWTVRDIAGHLLGAMEANASFREFMRQGITGRRVARELGRPHLDGINQHQVRKHAHLQPDELVARLGEAAPRSVAGRRRVPRPLRALRVPVPHVGTISLGFLLDVVYTRDAWIHRVDITQATGKQLILSASHDGRLVADVVAEWARRHQQPFQLDLEGPAGGRYRQGDRGVRRLRLDAVDFCLALSGRERGEGLLAQQIAF